MLLNKELVTGGKFDSWPGDNPTGWVVSFETSPTTDDIDAVDITAETFTISGEGDLSTWFKDGNIFEVAGSAGNDGQWTVESTVWSDPDFVITVTGNITNATANGTITPHPDPDISQVGTGEKHGGTGTGMCNLYTSDGGDIEISQNISLVIGKKYRVSINIDTVTAGSLRVSNSGFTLFNKSYSTEGIKTFTFVSDVPNTTIYLSRRLGGVVNDITFDDVSIREDIPAELSRTGHSFSSRQEM